VPARLLSPLPLPVPLLDCSSRPDRPRQGPKHPLAEKDRERIYGEMGKSDSYEGTWWPRNQKASPDIASIALVKK
jgi:hypothetical protein